MRLADEACEEALYDTALFREFAQIDLGEERVPDATTMLKFRRLLETRDLGRAIFDRVNALLASRGLKVAGGTMVDATIIHAASSTKNAEQSRDPQMHQTRKGNQWYFVRCAHLATRDRRKRRPGGMKLHVGRCGVGAVDESALCVGTNVQLHAKVPLVALSRRLIWVKSAFPTRRQCSNSAVCLKPTIWAERSLIGSTACWLSAG